MVKALSSIRQPDTTGSNKDGHEDSISKETASKDDQELRKKPATFLGATPDPWNYCALSNFDIFLKENIK